MVSVSLSAKCAPNLSEKSDRSDRLAIVEKLFLGV